MATFNDKELVTQMMIHEGYITEFSAIEERGRPDNPAAVLIVEYTTPEGQICWGVVFDHELRQKGDYWLRYFQETAYVRSPEMIWYNPRYIGYQKYGNDVEHIWILPTAR